MAERMSNLNAYKWYLLAGLLGMVWLVYLLSPMLSPFLFAGLLAYLGDPLVDRLEARKLPRLLSVVMVFVLMFGFVIVVPLTLLPVIESQSVLLLRSLPGYVDWMTETFLPALQHRFGVDPSAFDTEKIKDALMSNWRDAGSLAAHIVSYVSSSGFAVLAWLANIVLVPVLTFYMLIDWDRFIAGLRDLLPRSLEPAVVKLVSESDEMLAAFLRGQLLVMLSLGLVYSLGLTLIGLNTAVLIGLLAGLVSFVPYLGVIVGLLSAGIAMLLQTHDVMQLLPVALVFGTGQILEGMVLTPWLVGDKIGLHPVTVMFAILAGGQLFGFVGILLALPVAAVLVVLVRHMQQRYKESALYGEATEPQPGQESAELSRPD
jgi:predicted PurR-regulated permease PerM